MAVPVILSHDVIFNVPTEIMCSMKMVARHVHVQQLVPKSNVARTVVMPVMFEMKMAVKHVNASAKRNVHVRCVECFVNTDLNAMKMDANIVRVIKHHKNVRN